jgi:aromatic ring-opening dioxygenase catalytic subunit (LigB family)
MTAARMPAFYLCHGGGPWPWLQGPFRDMLKELERGLLQVPRQLPQRPSAILVVSSHWEERAFTVTSAPHPGMVYDYSGFPQEMYTISYPSPGSVPLAARVVGLLRAAGCDAASSATRGYDHSTYSLLKVMYPAADIPVVQLSLHASMDPALHLRAGAALAVLRDENILLIGSGMSCHERGPEMAVASPAFDQWLQQAVLQDDAQQRNQALLAWEEAPYARAVHPHEDHLLPLMVAAGAAQGDAASCIYRERLMGFIAVSSFRFGSDVPGVSKLALTEYNDLLSMVDQLGRPS